MKWLIKNEIIILRYNIEATTKKLSAIYAWKIAEENRRQRLVSAYVMRKIYLIHRIIYLYLYGTCGLKMKANNKHIMYRAKKKSIEIIEKPSIPADLQPMTISI